MFYHSGNGAPKLIINFFLKIVKRKGNISKTGKTHLRIYDIFLNPFFI